MILGLWTVSVPVGIGVEVQWVGWVGGGVVRASLVLDSNVCLWIRCRQLFWSIKSHAGVSNNYLHGGRGVLTKLIRGSSLWPCIQLIQNIRTLEGHEDICMLMAAWAVPTSHGWMVIKHGHFCGSISRGDGLLLLLLFSSFVWPHWSNMLAWHKLANFYTESNGHSGPKDGMASFFSLVCWYCIDTLVQRHENLWFCNVIPIFEVK